MSEKVDVTAVNNGRELIELDMIVTPLDREHEFGTGHVERIAGIPGARKIIVVWDNGTGRDVFDPEELTGVNIAQRERTLGA